MPRKSVFHGLTVDIPKGCYVDKNRFYVYYRQNSIRRPYKDRPGTYPDHDRICVGKANPPDSEGTEFKVMVPNANYPSVLLNILKASGYTDTEAAAELRAKLGDRFSFTGALNAEHQLKVLHKREENNYLDHVSLGVQTAFNVLARDSGLIDDLSAAFGDEEAFMVLDLAQYLLCAKNAVFQHFTHWAKTHALFTSYIPSDSKISSFISGISQSEINLFKKLWARRSIDDGKVILSYDSTNVGSQAEGVALVEKGHAKDDPSLDQINTEYVIRHKNGTPVTYSEYPGSINDIKEAKKMINFLGDIVSDVNKEREERNLAHLDIDIICDRGYISESNVKEMDNAGIGFLLMLRRNMGITENILAENIDKVRRPENYVPKHEIYAYTLAGKLYPKDKKERYFHIILDTHLEIAHKRCLYAEIEKLEKELEKMVKRKHEMTLDELKRFKRYFTLDLKVSGTISVKKKGKEQGSKDIDIFTITSFCRDNDSIFLYDRMCGHYILVTSKKITAVQAYEEYKKRDCVEKIFSTLKTRLGMDKYGVHSDNAVRGKTLVWFVASIMYSLINIKTEPLRAKNKKSFTTPCVIDYLEEYEADLDLETFCYSMRYSATRKQELVFGSLGINSNDFKSSLRKIEYSRSKS